MNDSREVKVGIEMLVEWCDLALKNEDRQYAINGLQEMKAVATDYDTRNLFCVCFSHDQDKLSQWRGYANHGNGYSIGFRIQGFKNDSLHLAIGNFGPVIYDVEKARENLFRKLPHFPENYEYKSLRDEVDKNIGFLKDPGFNEEDEWRLLIARDHNDNTKNFGSISDKIELFERNGVLVPYIDLKADKDKQLPIVKIVIGPCVPNIDNAKYSIEMLLEKCGYAKGEVAVVKSKIPFLP
jgi:hypothetical protein